MHYTLEVQHKCADLLNAQQSLVHVHYMVHGNLRITALCLGQFHDYLPVVVDRQT